MEPTPNNQKTGKRASKKVNSNKSTAKKNKELKTPSKDTCSHQEVEYLSGQIGEFLDAYILIGYDLSGNAISVYAAKSQQHADSLMTLMQTSADDIIDKLNPPSEE